VSKKIAKVYRQTLSLVVVTLLALILTVGLVFLALFSPSVQKNASQSKNNISYVLVNEDTGTSFNGAAYNLGGNFVKLINQETNENWQTASLSVANAGFKNGSYDVELVLPQDFSKKLLSLESLTPEQANITYKVRAGESELANAAIEQKVGEILNNFNQRIVQMYFASILGNLYSAQRNVGGIVYNQNNTIADLQNNVYTPFHTLPTNFTAVVSNAKMLETQNQTWQTAQNAFTKNTQDLLTQSADSLSQNLSQLTAYSALQKGISNINLQDTQASLTTQYSNDQTFYNNLYRLYHTTITKDLNQLYDPLGQTPSDFNTSAFQTAIDKLQASMSSKSEELNTQIGKLTDQATSLSALRETIANDYFADKAFDPTTATQKARDAATKTAIVSLIDKNQTNQNHFPQAYLDNLNATLSTLDPTDLQAMITTLGEANQSLGTNAIDDGANYGHELEIVQRYAAETSGVKFVTGQSYHYLTAQNGVYPQNGNYSLSGKYNFDTSKSYKLVFTSTPTATGTANLTLDSSDAATIAHSLNAALVGTGVTASAQANLLNGNEIDLSFKATVASSSTSSSTSSTSTSSSSSTLPKITAALDNLAVTWAYSGTETQNEYNEAPYTLELDNTTDNEVVSSSSGKLSAFVDLGISAKALKADTKQLLDQLDILSQCAREIVTIFGSSSASSDPVGDFLTTINANTLLTIKELAPSDSIYMRYGNLTESGKEDLISTALLKNYEQEGLDLWKNANDQQVALEAVINGGENGVGSLSDVLKTFPDAKTMQNELDSLKVWAEGAQKDVSDAYTNWLKAKVDKVSLTQQATDTIPAVSPNIIWYNDKTGQQVLTSFTGLITSSKTQALATAKSAQQIASVTTQFQDLTKQTTQVKTDTDAVLKNVDDLTNQAKKQATDNTNFSEQFNAVMANAHSGGSNKQSVFDFLSSPVNYIGSVGSIYKPNLIPYFMTLIGFILAVASGNGIRFIEKRRLPKDSEKLVIPTRVWRNAPTVWKATGLALALGLAFALSSQAVVTTKNIFLWEAYVFLVTGVGILLVSYLFRQLPHLSLYLLGAVFGLYLILTPFVGVTVIPNSYVDWLFRVSPLQNVENGYHALINGSGIGWLSFVILMVLFALSVVLNLTVKSEKMKEVAHEN
jgi:type VII secretion EsaA-like protein